MNIQKNVLILVYVQQEVCYSHYSILDVQLSLFTYQQLLSHQYRHLTHSQCVRLSDYFAQFYSFLGGVEGVIWTDVIQGIILLGGAVLVIILGAYHVGGFGQITQDALANGKIVTAEKFSWSLTASTIPIIFIGSVFNSLQQYTASQTQFNVIVLLNL